MSSRLAAARGASPGSREPAGSSMRYWPAAWRYWRSRMMSGSVGLVRSSTASMTTEPLWRTTSLMWRWPFGSSRGSVKTLKTRALKASLEESSLAPERVFFAVLGLAALAGADFLGFFEVAAIGLRYHPASGA